MKIALVGNPNSGKTTLFNCLTGMNAKIGNWPGVTIEKKVGTIKGTKHEIIDLPGIYSLSPYSLEEEISKKFIFEEKPDVIINIIDSTTLERSLYLTTQLLELDCKVIIALNMVDLLEKKGFDINEQKLEKILGASVIKISALKEIGTDKIIQEIENPIINNKIYIYDARLEQKIAITESNLYEKKHRRFIAVKLIEDDIELEELIATERYNFIERTKEKTVLPKNNSNTLEKTKKINITDKLDKVFLNKWLAFPVFAVIMFLIYYLSVGLIGKFTVDWISENVKIIGENIKIILKNIGTAEWLNSLIVDGIISGVGAVLSFIPQLIILFTCISILETTGYMSRIALLLDKLFRKIGLSGKSLIPFIVGSGCSVPGIMGTRIIENQDERELTAILTPFIPCSAKLPIIVLFSSCFFKQNAGIVSVSLYFLAIFIIIISAIIMKKFIYKNTSTTYISELPEYKLPNVKYVTRDVYDKTIEFFKRAGSIILICSVIIWFLLSFSFKMEYGVNIENSMLASIGKSISWIFYPMLGTNSWGATVSAIQGLIAKEQVISSMSIIAGLSKTGEAGKQIFSSNMFSFFTSSSAYAFMTFNLFSAPCFSAIGAMKKELGSTVKVLKVVTFQILFAWCLATLINQLKINLLLISIIAIAMWLIIKENKSANKECRKCPYCKDCNKIEMPKNKVMID